MEIYSVSRFSKLYSPCVLLGHFMQQYLSARPCPHVHLTFMYLCTLCSIIISPDAYLHIILLTHGASVLHQRFYSYFSALFFKLPIFCSYLINRILPNVHMAITSSKIPIFDPGLLCPLRNYLEMAFFAVRAKLK